MPQHFGVEFGWEEMGFGCVQQLDAAEERAKTGILAGNYPRGKTIDFFGRATDSQRD